MLLYNTTIHLGHYQPTLPCTLQAETHCKDTHISGVLVHLHSVQKMVIISRMSKHCVATGYGGKNDERLGLHKLPKNHKKKQCILLLR